MRLLANGGRYWCLECLTALVDQAPVLASRVINSGGGEVALTLLRVSLVKPAGGYVQVRGDAAAGPWLPDGQVVHKLPPSCFLTRYSQCS